MAIRVQNLPRKTLEHNSICTMPHFTGNFSPWWNLHEQQFSQTLSKNLSLRLESSPQHCQKVQHLHLQSQDRSSLSTQSSSPSPHELTSMGKANSQDQCASLESDQNDGCQKPVGEQVKYAFLGSNQELSDNPSQIAMSQSTAQIPYAYSDPYFSGLFNSYGPQPIIHSPMVRVAPARIPLPLDIAQDSPIYVNAKQYHGILRRRQMRAKLEAQKKLIKNRKPYLHESRHLHALNRVRGSGGRFLSKRKLQQSDPTPSDGSLSASVHSHQERNMLLQHSEANDRYTSTTTTSPTSSAVIGHTHHGLFFQ